jgi:chemotaxis protein methyltransferase CheR
MVWEETDLLLSPAPGLRILATDADPVCLKRARQGIYHPSSLKEVPEHARKRWFAKFRGTSLKVDPHLQTRITWHNHHLLDDPPPEQTFHLILLRNNLLTYYQGERLQNALAPIVTCLPAGGLLILGSHESLPARFSQMTRDPQCSWVYHATTRLPS